MFIKRRGNEKFKALVVRKVESLGKCNIYLEFFFLIIVDQSNTKEVVCRLKTNRSIHMTLYIKNNSRPLHVTCFNQAMSNLGLRKEWICNERPITICPIVTCWPHARTTR